VSDADAVAAHPFQCFCRRLILLPALFFFCFFFFLGPLLPLIASVDTFSPHPFFLFCFFVATLGPPPFRRGYRPRNPSAPPQPIGSPKEQGALTSSILLYKYVFVRGSRGGSSFRIFFFPVRGTFLFCPSPPTPFWRTFPHRSALLNQSVY